MTKPKRSYLVRTEALPYRIGLTPTCVERSFPSVWAAFHTHPDTEAQMLQFRFRTTGSKEEYVRLMELVFRALKLVGAVDSYEVVFVEDFRYRRGYVFGAVEVTYTCDTYHIAPARLIKLLNEWLSYYSGLLCRVVCMEDALNAPTAHKSVPMGKEHWDERAKSVKAWK